MTVRQAEAIELRGVAEAPPHHLVQAATDQEIQQRAVGLLPFRELASGPAGRQRREGVAEPVEARDLLDEVDRTGEVVAAPPAAR